jgi:hypothetical protein
VLAQRKFGDFQKLISTLDKVGHKELVLKLHSEEDNKVTIALRADPSRPGCSSEVWAHMQADQWFDEYSISSLNNNQIFLDLTLENLVQALRGSDKADKIAMRLAKNPIPCLNLEIRTVSTTISHTVPVDVWTQSRCTGTPLIEPAVDTPSTLVWLPQLQKLCSLLDKMKNIDNHLYLCADYEASTLRFRVATDTANFSAEFKVRMKAATAGDDDDAEVDEPLEVGVDIKMLARIMQCYQVGSKHAVLGLLDTVLLMQITAGGAGELQLIYYVPTLIC